jgi:hypothetical protein
MRAAHDIWQEKVFEQFSPTAATVDTSIQSALSNAVLAPGRLYTIKPGYTVI